jgi:hypothetical protein
MGKNKEHQITSQNKKEFIRRYPEYGSVGATLKAIGVKSRKTFYNWCDSDPKFKAVYEEELLPNRRDDCVSLLYQAAMGKLGTHIRTWTEKRTGNAYEEEVENELAETQRSAIFGFLKATDHNDDPKSPDRLIFAEKHQITGEGGGPIKVEINAKDKLLSILNSIAARGAETAGN